VSEALLAHISVPTQLHSVNLPPCTLHSWYGLVLCSYTHTHTHTQKHIHTYFHTAGNGLRRDKVCTSLLRQEVTSKGSPGNKSR